jgi:hypothetical protein
VISFLLSDILEWDGFVDEIKTFDVSFSAYEQDETHESSDVS